MMSPGAIPASAPGLPITTSRTMTVPPLCISVTPIPRSVTVAGGTAIHPLNDVPGRDPGECSGTAHHDIPHDDRPASLHQCHTDSEIGHGCGRNGHPPTE